LGLGLLDTNPTLVPFFRNTERPVLLAEFLAQPMLMDQARDERAMPAFRRDHPGEMLVRFVVNRYRAFDGRWHTAPPVIGDNRPPLQRLCR
jgi:hypothetical protein